MTDTVQTVLLIEDEPYIRRFVRRALSDEGWQVFEAETVARGLIECGTRHPDLVILDLGLPDGDGVDLLRDLRAWSNVAVIVLSARQNEADKIAALDAGADDYLSKPFGIGELLARVRATLRRRRQPSDSLDGIFHFGDISVDLGARRVMRNQEIVHLTPTEYRLLGMLIGHAGRVVTTPQLLREIWGPSHAQDAHYLRIYMGHLRHKLEHDPSQPVHLLTEMGIGYRLHVNSK